MTSATLIAEPSATPVERRRDESVKRAIRAGRRRRRRRSGFRTRPRGAIGASPPGAGGRLLQL